MYWAGVEKVDERFMLLFAGIGRRAGSLKSSESVICSRDTARRDVEGLYFTRHRDEMLKTSGYRASPNDVEEGRHATPLMGRCVAVGVDCVTLGQAIQTIATTVDGCAAQALPASGECMAGLLPPNRSINTGRKLPATTSREHEVGSDVK